MTPPIELPWPPMYFVAEYTTMAAPCSSGRHSSGAAVLSTTSGIPAARRDLRRLADGEHVEFRVGQGLGVEGAGPVVDGAAEVLRVRRVDEADLDPLVAQRVGEQVPGAAVKVGGADHVVAGVGDVLERERARRLPRRERERRRPALERRHALLERVLGRVHDPRVDVAELLEREQVRRVPGVAELVRGGLVDRHRDRTRVRVAAVPCVQDDGLRMKVAWAGHDRSSRGRMRRARGAGRRDGA